MAAPLHNSTHVDVFHVTRQGVFVHCYTRRRCLGAQRRSPFLRQWQQFVDRCGLFIDRWEVREESWVDPGTAVRLGNLQTAPACRRMDWIDGGNVVALTKNAA